MAHTRASHLAIGWVRVWVWGSVVLASGSCMCNLAFVLVWIVVQVCILWFYSHAQTSVFFCGPLFGTHIRCKFMHADYGSSRYRRMLYCVCILPIFWLCMAQYSTNFSFCSITTFFLLARAQVQRIDTRGRPLIEAQRVRLLVNRGVELLVHRGVGC